MNGFGMFRRISMLSSLSMILHKSFEKYASTKEDVKLIR